MVQAGDQRSVAASNASTAWDPSVDVASMPASLTRC
jgi:hypothetical protein